MSAHVRSVKPADAAAPAARPAWLKIVTVVVLGGGGLAALLAGPEALLGFASVLFVLGYVELRRLLLHPPTGGSRITLVGGAAAVAAFSWVGYARGPETLVWVAAALLLSTLVVRVLLVEVAGRVEGATSDVAGTVTAAGIVGLLGAHVLLIRAIPRFGFRGTLAFGLIVLANGAAAFIGSRAVGRRPLAQRIAPRKTWEGALLGLAAGLVVGLIAAIVWDPPFSLASGLGLAAALGLLAPIGDLAQSALKRGTSAQGSVAAVPVVGDVLDVLDSVLFCAPFFYWAYRTLVI